MENKQRQSNIEALRLLSMLMVLNLHSFKGYNHLEGTPLLFDFLRESTSICAVDVFLLISGYFGIRWKFKSFFNLAFQIFFYSFGVYIVAAQLGYIDFTMTDFLSCAKGLYASWGFVTGYVLLYFFAPILNEFADNVSKKQLLFTIVILWLAKVLICRDFSLSIYLLMYLIGRFLAKSDAVNNLYVNAKILYWGSTALLTLIAFFLCTYTSINNALSMSTCILTYDYSAPLCILQAISLFLIFARLQFHSNFINWCSASAFSIFLIHMHPSIKNIGYYSYTDYLYELPLLEHIGLLILLIVLVFMGSILVDKIRIFISNMYIKY